MMQLIRGLHNVRDQVQGCVLAIGNFDGLHRGHQALIQELVRAGRQYDLPAVIMTFEPQPNEFFSQDEPTPRLMRLREKMVGCAALGIDTLICVRFDAAFAAMTAEDFVETLLVQRLGVRLVLVGDDFRFGARRTGDMALLKKLGAQHQFDVMTHDTVSDRAARISSTRVRRALQAGDLKEAETLLGHPYMLLGKVSHGDKRGRVWGCPTANIHLHRRSVPMMGIFVVRVYDLEDAPIEGVASLGVRPSIGGTRTLLEVHLFDFDRDIYGKNIRVEFIHKLRDELKFDAIQDLIDQIHRDVQDAKRFFKENT